MAKVRADRHMPRLYLRSLLGSLRSRSLFEDVRTFVLFIGLERSGSTLLGSLLNAHPRMVISHELNVLRFVEWHFRREQIFYLILERDRWFGRIGRSWTDYEYAVPNQYQGRFEGLEVIGDKRAAATAFRVLGNTAYLQHLRSIVRVPLRIVHTVRNPFDNISTMAARYHASLAQTANIYFRLSEAVEMARTRVSDEEWVEVRHEDLVADPTAVLEAACEAIGVEAGRSYLDDCAAVVWPEVNRSRLRQPWTEDLVRSVGKRMTPYPWLDGYSFQE